MMKLATLVKLCALAACCTTSLLVPALDGGGSAIAGTACLVVEDHTPYRCDWKRDDNVVASTCMRVHPSTLNPNQFLMHFPVSGAALRCACTAAGSFNNPKYNTSKAFLCNGESLLPGVNPVFEHDSASGTVSGAKITKGSYLDGFAPFHEWVYQCKPDPNC